MSNITIMTGEQAGKTYEIANRPISIGRDPSRDIQILDMKVSRKHALIRFVEKRHVLSSMKSTNGLWVNGEDLDEEAILNDGDEISLGETVLRFTFESSPDYTNAVHHRKVSNREARDANTMM